MAIINPISGNALPGVLVASRATDTILAFGKDGKEVPDVVAYDFDTGQYRRLIQADDGYLQTMEQLPVATLHEGPIELYWRASRKRVRRQDVQELLTHGPL